MTYHQNFSNTTGDTSDAETALPSGTPKFNPCFSGVCISQSLAFYAVFRLPLFYSRCLMLSMQCFDDRKH
jgi:hypothetical protein